MLLLLGAQLPLLQAFAYQICRRNHLLINYGSEYITNMPSIPSEFLNVDSPLKPHHILSALGSIQPRKLHPFSSSTHPAILASLARLSSLPDSAAQSQLHTRQTTTLVAIPLTYKGLNSGPQPGTVVGIVLGSVFGTLLLLWLIRSVAGSVAGGGGAVERDDETEIIYRHHRSRSASEAPPRRKRRKPARSEAQSEMAEAPRRRTERVIVQEERVRQGNGPPPPPPEPVVERERVVVEERTTTERRVPGDDMVEVIEEESSVSSAPPARKKESKRNSGFRTVDPTAYGGGNYPQREVRSGRR